MPYPTTLAVVMAFAVFVSSCTSTPAARPPLLGTEAANLNAFQSAECGARIYVAMGESHHSSSLINPPRIPEGVFYVDEVLVDRITANPEISVFDVPAGVEVQLSWMRSDSDDSLSSITTQDTLSLTLAEGETAFFLLDWYVIRNVMPFVLLAPIGLGSLGDTYRTEVVRVSESTEFADMRVVHYESLPSSICVLGD